MEKFHDQQVKNVENTHKNELEQLKTQHGEEMEQLEVSIISLVLFLYYLPWCIFVTVFLQVQILLMTFATLKNIQNILIFILCYILSFIFLITWIEFSLLYHTKSQIDVFLAYNVHNSSWEHIWNMLTNTPKLASRVGNWGAFSQCIMGVYRSKSSECFNQICITVIQAQDLMSPQYCFFILSLCQKSLSQCCQNHIYVGYICLMFDADF